MTIIQGVIGSVQGSSGGGYQASTFARPGWGNPNPNSGYSPGNQGTPYNPDGAVSSVPGIAVHQALRRTAYYGIWSTNYGYDHPEVFDGTTQEILSDNHILFNSDSTQDNYVLEWKGYFYAPNTANYNWSCSADDVVYVWLGSAALSPDGSNWLCRGTTNGGLNINSVTLAGGNWYPIRIRYQEWGGAETMIVYAGQSGSELLGLNYYADADQLKYNGISDGY